jgi:formamidopyrimidine-DNA glycosylase
MPELPEVEYTARQLRDHIIGATIREALVFWERTIGHPDLPDFLSGIAERRIIGVRRRGKFLVLDLKGTGRPQGVPLQFGEFPDSDFILTIHRRMTGNLLMLPDGWEVDMSLRQRDPIAWSVKGPSFKWQGGEDGGRNSLRPYSSELLYCRVCFDLADGRRLLFTDPRKFGRIELWPRERELEALEGLGPEPLGDEFTVERLMQALAGRKGAIKQALLAQEVIAGLGNIYPDEALYYASIHPLRHANSLTLTEVELLREGIISVLTLGIEHGGTSFSEYRDLWGEAGDNYNHVRVYHQQGQPCVRCGTPIERIVVAQRSTHFCPKCQKLIEE